MNHDPCAGFAARADLCRLLAACYYQPGPEFTEERLFDSMVDAASRIDDSLAADVRHLRQAFGAEDLQELLIDYTRLFLGPMDALAKPYGSVWLEGRQSLMQDSTMAVLELYAEGGFEIDDGFREVPDHVAAELEFLYLLLFRRVEALRNTNADDDARYRDLQRRFLDEHLGRWAAPFAAAMQDGAQSAFYRELAALTEAFVHSEAAAARAD